MLLVSEDGPIHLRLLSDTLDHQLTDLKTVVLKPGEDAFSPGAPAEAIARAVEDFRQAVVADEGYEGQLRRALGWLLNLDDARLGPITQQLKMSFPEADVGRRRRFLEMLWRETFADWKVDGFDPDQYELRWRH